MFIKIIAEKFPNKGEEFNIYISEAHRTANSPNQNRTSPQFIRLKILKVHHENGILKVALWIN